MHAAKEDVELARLRSSGLTPDQLAEKDALEARRRSNRASGPLTAPMAEHIQRRSERLAVEGATIASGRNRYRGSALRFANRDRGSGIYYYVAEYYYTGTCMFI